MGAHFASDATVGAAMTIRILIVLKTIIKNTNVINNKTI